PARPLCRECRTAARRPVKWDTIGNSETVLGIFSLTAIAGRCTAHLRGRSRAPARARPQPPSGRDTNMAYLTRRSMLRGSLALAATGTFAAPRVARAAATTASVWFTQGFVQDEDVSLRKTVAEYEKQSGNKIELSITPFAPERQKIVAAITS